MADETVRQFLRRSTLDAHEALDRDLGSLDLTDRGAYTVFLRRQYAARAPIEAWVHANALAALTPPDQTPLIARDLQALGASCPPFGGEFRAPSNGAIGVAWALAGSSLGNRTMLRRIERAGASLPTTFLANRDMPEYFARLRPRLETAAASETALTAARDAALAVFAFFADVAPKADRTLENAA